MLWLSDNATVQTRIMKLRATRGACNPNLQVAITQMYGTYVASPRMNSTKNESGMHRMQSDHMRLDLTSLFGNDINHCWTNETTTYIQLFVLFF